VLNCLLSGFIVADDRADFPDENTGSNSRPRFIPNMRDEIEIDEDELRR
jgi:hypothetical protein